MGCCDKETKKCCEGHHLINKKGQIFTSSVYCKKYPSINGASADLEGLRDLNEN